jgi:2-C-methyl-D-erythritol 4-phosphate cytidylyltransferase
MAPVFVIVPAAGLGTRMQAATGTAPKQFHTLEGRPILIHTLRSLTRIAGVAGIWIAVRPEERERMISLLAEHAAALPAGVPLHVVAGGDTRQESVSRALTEIACEDGDIILVHDAVRPLLDPDAADRVIAAVARHGAAILAVPATDTVKQVERMANGALITATIPRENIVLAQTPQGARAGLLRSAFRDAEADGFSGTDEASMLERAGIPVAVVAGAASNLKITQAADLPLAEWYLARQGR